MSFALEHADGAARSITVVRDAAFDGRPHTELLLEAAPLALTDEQGRRYQGCFDGHTVEFFESGGGAGSNVVRWVQGSAPVRLPGGAPLDSRFLFTFFDHGRTAQRLNALWEFSGTSDEAIAAFSAAGFARPRLDNRRASSHIHLRSPGTQITGRDSAHAIVYAGTAATPTRGEIHVGEHNPLRGFGIGFLLHQWEIRRGAH